jgi:hypothetical protein
MAMSEGYPVYFWMGLCGSSMCVWALLGFRWPTLVFRVVSGILGMINVLGIIHSTDLLHFAANVYISLLLLGVAWEGFGSRTDGAKASPH